MISLFTLVADKMIFFVFNTISDEVYTGQSIGKLNHYLKVKDDLDLIVYGSSRANRCLNPDEVMKNSFNMGMDGRKLAYSATLMKLLPKDKNQLVLLHIDPDNAYDKNYSGRDIKALGSKYNRIEIVKNEINRLKQNNILQTVFWSLSYNGSILGIIKNYLMPKYDYKKFSGYEPFNVNAMQRKVLENILKEKTPQLCQNDLILNKHYNRLLNELKRFCDENNKIIIVFSSPKYNDTCKDDNLKFRQLMKEKGFSFYDFTDYFRDNNKIEFWKDKTHLSREGAEIFSKKMKEILKPYVQSY